MTEQTIVVERVGDEVARAIAERVVRDLGDRIVERAAELLAREMAGITPERVYPLERAAELMGITSKRRVTTLAEYIPAKLLPRVSITPTGGLRGVLGRDLLNYIERQRRSA